jgi:pimeloyl-ACP methyl ester carboxylesterase
VNKKRPVVAIGLFVIIVVLSAYWRHEYLNKPVKLDKPADFVKAQQKDVIIKQLKTLSCAILGRVPLRKVKVWAENHAIFQRSKPVTLNDMDFEHDPDLLYLKRAFSEGLLREIDIKCPPNNIKLHAWFLRPRNNMPTVVYSYGRGDDLSEAKYLMESFARRGFGFLEWSYPGYEHSEGYPSEQSLYEGLNAMSNYLVSQGIQPGDQIAMGHSLGGAVSVNAATKIPFRLVVLIATFTTVPDYYEHLVKTVPWAIRWMCTPKEEITQHFDALSKMPFVKSPVLFIYGDKDEEVPLDMARKLFSVTKTLHYEYVVKDAPHDLDIIPKFAEEIGKTVCSYQNP